MSWFQSGDLAGVAHWQGVRDGPYVRWHYNGKVEEIGNAVDGEQQGRVRVWDEDGELTMDTIIEPGD